MTQLSLDTIAPVNGRRRYVRPLEVAIAISVFGELLLLILFGWILFPAGSLLTKLVWTIVYCGVGMGCVYGAALTLLVTDRFHGAKAVLASTALSVGLLGFACDELCFRLAHHFGYFGATENGALFRLGGMAFSAIGGIAVGLLCFTAGGRRLLERLGV